jgi:ABC-type nitrate/sulfonate/bicarbonate transport system ATPase subunit
MDQKKEGHGNPAYVTPSGRPSKVVVTGLTKKFGDLLVLDNISFHVGEGEFLAIVGPTGCGKTTFLNVLSKLTPATSGNILIDGDEANPRRHNLAFVFQEPSSMPWLTVRENVAFGMKVKGVNSQERETRTQAILDLVGLTSCCNLLPNQISASMEQRVSVARAFATNPDLLLMDEPYGQLDVKLRYYLEDELIRLWQETKRTVIFVTHNIEEAVYLADRILILTNKPTTIRKEVMVNLTRPRHFLDEGFMEIRKEVTDLIRWW